VRWFRFYAEARTDPKVMALPPVLFRAWVDILCMACESKMDDGCLPPVGVIAVAQHWSIVRTETALEELVKRGLLDRDKRGLRPHNWKARQYKSDSSTERVRKHRRNGVIPVTETFPQRPQRQIQRTETDAETEGPPAAASDPVLVLLSKNFANELGTLSVGVEDELRDWSERIPANGRGEKCVEYAFREAAAQSHRSWSYVAAILTRLESEGWPAEPETVAPPGKAEADWLERRYQRGKATT